MARRVLVAVDGSEPAERALREAADLTRAFGTALTVLTVVVPDARPVLAEPYASPLPSRLEELEREGAEILERAVASAPDGVAVEAVTRKGSPGPAILEQIEEGGHDLVVVGSRGLGAIRSLVLGSVSRYVLDHSPVSVLIVR